MGLRIRPNTPVCTSVVVSFTSSPIRQESPISSCAKTVAAMPAVATTMPTVCTQTALSILTGSTTLVSCRMGALTATISATTKPIPATRSVKPPALMPRKPVEPVRRYCTQLRQPNPSIPKIEKSTRAMSAVAVGGISGPPMTAVMASDSTSFAAVRKNAPQRRVDGGGARCAVTGAGHQGRQRTGGACALQCAQPLGGRTRVAWPARGQHSGEHVACAGGVHRFDRRGGYRELAVRADVAGAAGTESDHQVGWPPGPFVGFVLVRDHHVRDGRQFGQRASVLAGR